MVRNFPSIGVRLRMRCSSAVTRWRRKIFDTSLRFNVGQIVPSFNKRSRLADRGASVFDGVVVGRQVVGR